MSIFADLWRMLDRAQRRQLLILQMLALLMAVSTLAGLGAVMPFFAALGSPGSVASNATLFWLYRFFGFGNHYQFVIALGIGFAVLVLLSNALNLAGSIAMYRFAHHIGNHFSVSLFNEYANRGLQFHLASNSATLFNNIVWEVGRGTTGLVQSVFILSTNVATSVLILGAIFVLHPLIAVAAVGSLAGSYGLIYMFARQRLLRNGLQESVHTEERIKIVNESLGAIREIIVLRAQEFFSENFKRSSWSISRSAINTHAIALSPRHVLECIVVAGLISVALLLIGAGEHGNWLAQLSFLGFAAYRLLPALQQIFHAAVKIRGDRAAFYRIADDLRCACQKGNGTKRNRQQARGNEWTGRPLHDIQLNMVSFQYSTARAPVVRDVTLNISAGSTVGLVGPSGSGKTTIAELILGLLEPTAGAVQVDGIQLDDSNRADWRATIGYVPQEIFLFDASLAENIAFATAMDCIDWARLAEAARLAQLDEFVRTLPAEYREVIGEHGVRLSGGQRQRIGIARALYHRSSVLIMDEATNSLDGMTESEIVEMLAGLRGSHTIILVAHRLSTVRSCDVIFQLDNGNVVESGSYDELMRRSVRFNSLMRGNAKPVSAS
jgi:ABC-type multidrug transport system fused ATPase/permease subunit